MNDANIATNITTNDTYDPEMRLDRSAARIGQSSRRHSADRARYLLNTGSNSSYRPTFEAHADRQVREDRGFYIPDFLSAEHYDANPQAYSAAEDHAKHLLKAERLLDEAWNLVGLMLASLGDQGDSRAMQTEAGLRVIEKKLGKAHNQIDKHNTRHTNLFLAYFDLKDKTGEGDQL